MGHTTTHSKISSYRDLLAWQKSHELAVLIRKLVKQFPKDEKYDLTSQIKRSSSSISANIAEGFTRKTRNDKIRFYQIATGSLAETQNHLDLAEDLNFITEYEHASLLELSYTANKLIHGLIKSAKDWNND